MQTDLKVINKTKKKIKRVNATNYCCCNRAEISNNVATEIKIQATLLVAMCSMQYALVPLQKFFRAEKA